MEAKMTSILEALRCCASKNYMGMEFESNSLVTVKIIKNEWQVPWELRELVEELRRSCQQ